MFIIIIDVTAVFSYVFKNNNVSTFVYIKLVCCDHHKTFFYMLSSTCILLHALRDSRQAFPIAHSHTIEVKVFQNEASLEVVERRAPNNSKNCQWTMKGDVSLQ